MLENPTKPNPMYSIYVYKEGIGLMSIGFANSSGDRDSIVGRVISKTQKMVIDAALLSTERYKVRSRIKWSNPRNQQCPLVQLRVVAIERGAFGLPLTRLPTLLMPKGQGIEYSVHSYFLCNLRIFSTYLCNMYSNLIQIICKQIYLTNICHIFH